MVGEISTSAHYHRADTKATGRDEWWRTRFCWMLCPIVVGLWRWGGVLVNRIITLDGVTLSSNSGAVKCGRAGRIGDELLLIFQIAERELCISGKSQKHKMIVLNFCQGLLTEIWWKRISAKHSLMCRSVAEILTHNCIGKIIRNATQAKNGWQKTERGWAADLNLEVAMETGIDFSNKFSFVWKCSKRDFKAVDKLQNRGSVVESELQCGAGCWLSCADKLGQENWEMRHGSFLMRAVLNELLRFCVMNWQKLSYNAHTIVGSSLLCIRRQLVMWKNLQKWCLVSRDVLFQDLLI